MTHDTQEWALPMPKHMEEYFSKKGGKRKKTKVKASQNVNVIVKNIMRNDRTMIYPNTYLKQMENTQNTGRQNLFSGPPLQYASPPQVMYIAHPNVGKESLSDLIGDGTNPNPNRHRVVIEDDNKSQGYLQQINPNDIMPILVPSRRITPSTQTMPAFSVTGASKVTPYLPASPMKGGDIPHMHSAGDDQKAEAVQMRAEPSEPSAAGVNSQIIGGVEQMNLQQRLEAVRRGRPTKPPGAPKGPYVKSYGPRIPKEFQQREMKHGL